MVYGVVKQSGGSIWAVLLEGRVENAVVIGGHGLAERVEAKRHTQPPESPRIPGRAVCRLEAGCRDQHDKHELNNVAGDRRVTNKSDDVTSECPGRKEKELARGRHAFFRPRPKEKLEI